MFLVAVAEEVMRGDPWDAENIFNWEHIFLNLPGLEGYNPSSPWISKQSHDCSVGLDDISFANDLRHLRSSESIAGK